MTQTHTTMPFPRYRLMTGAFLAQFVALGIYSYVLGSFMAPMSDELGWSRGDFTLSRAIGQVVMATAGIFIGALIDRIGPRPIMAVGTLVLSSVLMLHSQIETLWAWWLLNGIALTLGCAMIGNLVVNVTLSKWFVLNRGKAIAIAAMGVSLGGIIITPLATYLVDELGWRAAWVWLGVLSFCLMVPVTWAMRSRPEDYGLFPDGLSEADYLSDQGERARVEAEGAYTRNQALRTLSFYALVVAFGFFSINIVVLLLHTIPYLTDNGIDRQEAALAMVIASIPAMLSKPVWGALIDRVSVKPLAAMSASLTGLALLLIVGAVQAGNLTLIYSAFVVLGLGWGGMIPMQEVIWASFFGRTHIGAIRGAGLPFAFALGALAPWLVGVHVDVYGEYHRALQVVGALNVMSGVLIYLVRPPPKRHAL
ncbi:MAG: MFS transporter [Pseudomonadales bacterium]